MTVKMLWAAVLALAAAGDPLLTLMPADGVPPGWMRRGEAHLFVGAALYRHINGGAELYHRNGFDRLAVQDYVNGAHELRVEIYRMNEPAGAAGVFAELTAGLAAQTLYGTACVLDDFQVLFMRGDCLVSLTAYESRAETQEALAALAAALDGALARLAR